MWYRANRLQFSRNVLNYQHTDYTTLFTYKIHIQPRTNEGGAASIVQQISIAPVLGDSKET